MLSERMGGVEFAFVRYTQALLEMGHDVTSCVAHDAPIVSHLPAGCDKTSLPASFEYNPITLLSTRALAKHINPDIVITHGRRAFVTFANCRRTLRKSFGIVTVLHRAVFSRISEADRIICVSKDIVAAAVQNNVPDTKLVHIPNFIIARDMKAAQRAAGPVPVIGFLGRMVREKGLDLLIEALGIVRAMHLPFSVLIGGDGPEFAQMKELAAARGLSDAIQWKGWTSDTARFYGDIDFLVVPSRHETFGLVTLEAFNSCRPVLATRTSGSREIIQHGRNGWLCDISAAAIAEGILQFLRDPQWRASLAANAYKDVEAYTARGISGKLEACLQSAIKPSRAIAGEAAVQH